MANSLLEPKRRLGELLVGLGYLTADQVADALRMQADSLGAKLLGEVLLEQNLCTEEQLLEGLAAQFSLPFVRLHARLFDAQIVHLLPREFIEQHAVLPLFKVRNVLTVAAADPSNVFLLDRLRELTQCQIQVCLATAKDIRRTIQSSLPNTQRFVIDEPDASHAPESWQRLIEACDDCSPSTSGRDSDLIVHLVNKLLSQAVRDRASDLHFEPTDQDLRVRCRHDGVLYKMHDFPRHVGSAILDRLKRMAAMTVGDQTRPQEGRISVTVENRDLELVASTLLLRHGEKLMVGIQDRERTPLTLPQLGFSTENLNSFESQIGRPSGLVVIVGPSGSGKRTTLYAALQRLSAIEKNVCSVEHSIRCTIPLVNQLEVNDRGGLGLAASLRSMLQQAPDVVMVDDLHHDEAARLAAQAALSGRLILGGLPVNDAVIAISQLLRLGVPNYLLATVLNGVLTQRLCRRTCAKCRQPYEPAKGLQTAVSRLGYDIREYTRGVGCQRCRNSGFVGRIAVHEMLVADDELRELISTAPATPALRDCVRARRQLPLLHDGLRKVAEGLTTVEEIFHVSGDGV